MPVQNAEIAAMFDETAELLEIRGDNPFRIRAYRRAARVIAGLPHGVAGMLAAGEDLAELPGIGDDLAGKIAAIVATGHFELLDHLREDLPGGITELATLPGLGPKRIRLLHDALGVDSIDSLRKAVTAGRLRELPGFGEKIEARLRTALDRPTGERRYKLAVAEEEARSLVAYLRADRGVHHVDVAGSYRRRRDTVGDLDLLVTLRPGGSGLEIGARLARYDNVDHVLMHGAARTSVVLRSGLQVDLRVVPDESYGAALLYFTGSKAHNIALRMRAVARGWKLNEYGLFEGDRRIAGATEDEVYARLGLDTVPPEMREDRGEIGLAERRRLPWLVQASDIKGDLHVHSDWSDGTASIAAMAAAARVRGYAYMAITDHSRRMSVAHGLDADRLARQIDEIDRLNGTFETFTILKGIEVDILADGTLDLPDAILSRLDLVVAAVHTALDLPRAAQTERIIRAMDNRLVSIIAHPTGRLIGERPPCAIDMERVLEAARDRGCHLEINAQPDRMDLDDIQAMAARELGVKLAISTDAHAPGQLDTMRFGVDQARRAWLGPEDVINTRPLADLRRLLRR